MPTNAGSGAGGSDKHCVQTEMDSTKDTLKAILIAAGIVKTACKE